ncbi:hypothetical protein CC78DRAFT_618886 [Lojkania enalia]|uniref:Small ribosomal subunit protein uS10m n=1 Tax=Lojkania enalia TaxID=147567 RepID=A0A9P4MY55_9PLEO|nr:hypothetical protein CC78DRAFT_618886 [Didymosphaeria enalia]
MAAPRCTNTLLGPVKRIKISPPKPYLQTLSRARSAKADNEELRDDRGFRPGEYQGFDENMTFDERVRDFGVDPEEYKTLLKSQRRAEMRQRQRDPQTAEEAVKLREKMKKTPDHYNLLSIFKGAGVEPIKLAKERGIELPGGEKQPLDLETQKALDALRAPINVQAIHLRPLRRTAEHGIPVCDLQLRTYSIRNLQFFADFAMRAAYYMGLPARGPIPLPRITERWTVPRANFIFKKSQENFERITMRRLIQIQDGHPDVVKAWLAFLQKHQYHGVGMKANIWEYESLEAATSVGTQIQQGQIKGRRDEPMLKKVREILQSEGYREAMKNWKAPGITA